MKFAFAFILAALPSATFALEPDSAGGNLRKAAVEEAADREHHARREQEETTLVNPVVTRKLEEAEPVDLEFRRLTGCVNVGVYQLNFLTTTQANNIKAAINIANSGTPSASLCWNGIPITSEANLITAANSGTVDILIGLNWNNFAPIWTEGTKNSIASALTAGTLKKLLVYDRFANNDVKFPGLAPGSVVRNVGLEPITPINSADSPNVGPGGTVGTWSACYSNHGFLAPVGTLTASEFHFKRAPDSKPVSIQFCYSNQLVFYTTQPEDAYLDGFTCDSPLGSANKLFANTLWKIATEFCCTATATTYRLWNAATNTLVGPLIDGSSHCINYPYNIEVIPQCPTLPVGLKIWPQGGSTITRQKEYEAPYFLWGNLDADVLPNKKPLPAGVYYVSNLDQGDKITFTQTCAV